MKVLLSAYACSPQAGSEPGVGYATMIAVAQQHEVWVLTRTKNLVPIEQSLKGLPLAGQIRLIGIDLPPRAMKLKKSLGNLSLQWYYDRWQLLAAQRGAEMNRSVKFDVAHHVTFAADWSRAGIADLNIPFVWGPIGGRVAAPNHLLSTLGFRGITEETLRTLGRRIMRSRPCYRRSWRSSRVVLVQNRETAAHSLDQTKTRLLPNSTALLIDPVGISGPRTKEVVVVGRLIAWKGGILALRAFAQVRDQAADLHFLGSGPEELRLRRWASKLGLAHRVRFEGALPRAEVLERVARAGALLHPAVHDESPVAVGEALSLGTPVVCLDRGGPAELLRRWRASPSIAIAVGSPGETAHGLAAGIDKFLVDQPPIAGEAMRPSPSYAASILSAYEEAAG